MMAEGGRWMLKEGAVFAIPLRRGGHCLGLISRRQPRGQLATCYVFGPRVAVLPSVSEWLIPSPSEAVLKVNLAFNVAPALHWVDLGVSPRFDRELWKLDKKIVVGGGPGGIDLVVELDDKNSAKELRTREAAPGEIDEYPRDEVNTPEIVAAEADGKLSLPGAETGEPCSGG